MNILLLATHYSNEQEVRRFAAQVENLARPSAMTIRMAIADNSGDWNASTPLPAMTTIVRCPVNRGYANGCEFAWRHVCDGIAADWVFVCNTDLTLDADFFVNLGRLKLSDEIGVVAPAITRADGLAQNPHFQTRPTNWRMRSYLLAYRFGAVLTAMEAVSRWKQRLRRWIARTVSGVEAPGTDRSGSLVREPQAASRAARDIYAAHGSLFGLSRAFFSRGGRIGYESFLYGEEIHIAEQARRSGLKVRFVPELTVTHHAKAVTGRQHVGQRRRWKYESMRYLFQTYFRASPGMS